MKAEEYLEKHLEVISEALGAFRVRMEDRSAEFALASTVSDSPEVLQEPAEAFGKLADEASSAIRDLNAMTRFNDEGKRVLRKRKEPQK